MLKILKRMHKYTSKYEDSGVLLLTVRSKGIPSPDELAAVGLVGYSCGHSHDCCGCWQYNAPRVVRHNKRNEWFIEWYAYRNL